MTVTEDLGNVTFIHTDGLGSPVARTDSAGTVLSRTRYEPYGYVAAGATPTIGFTGHVNDADTGLTYMQQRYYEPVAGRFLSVDPVSPHRETASDFNRYVYANNNPYKYTDPDGRQACLGLNISARQCANHLGASSIESSAAVEVRSIANSLKEGARISVGTIAAKAATNSSFERKLWDLFITGRLQAYHVKENEFHDIVQQANVYGRAKSVTFSDGTVGEARQMNTYGSADYGYAIGRATIFMQGGVAVEMRDTYNFDSRPWGVRGNMAEIATRLAEKFSQDGPHDFEICYGKQAAGTGC